MKPEVTKSISFSRKQLSPRMPPVWVVYSVLKGCWILVDPYPVTIKGETLLIPKGFECDLASIPRPLWRLIAPFELSLVAPMVHDFIYRAKGRFYKDGGTDLVVTRKEADDLFLELMELEGVSKWKRKVAYRAVRAFGSRW